MLIKIVLSLDAIAMNLILIVVGRIILYMAVWMMMHVISIGMQQKMMEVVSMMKMTVECVVELIILVMVVPISIAIIILPLIQ
jgi:hypothetical protein